MNLINKNLKRYPHHNQLQAWDAADEYILEEVTTNWDLKTKKLLIINDSFGALTASLTQFEPTTFTDSFVSKTAIEQNAKGAKVISNLGELNETYGLVLIKIPKNLSFFEDILHTLSQCLEKDTPIIFGGMIKYMVKEHFNLINSIIGETSTNLAKKKARLIFTKLTQDKITNPFPISCFIKEMNQSFTNHSNLFSRNKLDIGTRFFLENLPQGDYQTILDLGCANGIVGIKAKQQNPAAKIIFTDDSYMAIKSAKENYATIIGDQSATFCWTNCYEAGEESSISLVLCNPPFHQGNTVGVHIAEQMFKDAHRTLKRGGLLRVIGNSHLGYQKTLKRTFGSSKIIASNQKFMIIDVIK